MHHRMPGRTRPAGEAQPEAQAATGGVPWSTAPGARQPIVRAQIAPSAQERKGTIVCSLLSTSRHIQRLAEAISLGVQEGDPGR